MSRLGMDSTFRALAESTPDADMWMPMDSSILAMRDASTALLEPCEPNYEMVERGAVHGTP